MADQMPLALTEDERNAIAHDLRRYGNYRERVAADLWNSQVLPEPGEPDPPGITPQVEQMTESHYAVTDHCESLAAAFESDEPVPLSGAAINLIESAMNEAYPDELPPEVARTAMYCRLVQRRQGEAYENDMDTPGRVVMVTAEPQPLATERFALALAQRLNEMNTALSDQLTELRKSQQALNERIQTQQREIERLRGRGGKRRRLPNPFSSGLDPADQSRRPNWADQERTL